MPSHHPQAPRPAGRRPTVRQVAERAGVSHQTVSRFLRGDPGMKPATVERLQEAVKALDYRPDLAARTLRTGRSGVLTAILPGSVTAFPTPTLAAAAEEAHAAGYYMEVAVVAGTSQVRAERAVELLASGRSEGVLFLGDLPDGGEPTGLGRGAFVTFGHFDDQLRGVGQLADATPVAEAIVHLAQLGHRRFLHLAGPSDFSSARARQDMFEATLAERAADFPGLASAGVVPGDWGAASGYDGVASRERLDFTAIIAANDVVASGALRALAERGARVPEDVSIVGWDDREMGRYMSPSLSTVAVDRRAQGRAAMRRLIALVRGEEPEFAEAPINRLIWRESAGPASEKAHSENS
ncbi:LacI family DNA-binding transcriptional regulator [Zhihengliuella flava]|uniref:DNA-binding LacI/PurR family transcriptional regulator n=1 Tax=Zhihengliuella flava TaxID=1285193 RepID=A0A931GEJ0_9MICC|nr:LacI family DNA-binding transcriptional regulator [Zhihengliuella flava]MBG6084468.1 DNA-binding LacI/PurR family transcriptional regulator [Zhihengliuella flava]